MIKAVVFDFDGLILDTELPWYEAFSEIYQEHGAYLPLELWVQCVGTSDEHFNPYDHLEQCIGKPIDRSSLQALSLEKHTTKMQKQAVRPGVRSYLQDAQSQGLRIGLASSSNRHWVERFLKEHGLFEYFECIRTSDDVHKVKPDPELYVQALECLGVESQHAVAFEDSLNGARAAKRAGMYCVIVPNELTRHLTFEEYDLRLNSMAEMGLEQVIAHLAPKMIE